MQFIISIYLFISEETDSNEEMNQVFTDYFRDEFIKAYYESFKQNESIIFKSPSNSDGQAFIQHYFEAFQKDKSNQSIRLSQDDMMPNQTDVNFKVIGIDYDYYMDDTSLSSNDLMSDLFGEFITTTNSQAMDSFLDELDYDSYEYIDTYVKDDLITHSNTMLSSETTFSITSTNLPITTSTATYASTNKKQIEHKLNEIRYLEEDEKEKKKEEEDNNNYANFAKITHQLVDLNQNQYGIIYLNKIYFIFYFAFP